MGRLLDRAQAEGAELPGPDGLLSRVARAVLERALAEEMTGHLGYEKHDPAGRGSGNSATALPARPFGNYCPELAAGSDVPSAAGS